AKRAGKDKAMQFRNLILQMPVKIVSATDNLVWTAVHFKASYPIAYADAFAAAVAANEDAAIVTGDKEFEALPNSSIFWLERKSV
ncbi:MAG: PIN domain-containing protein, partial [Rubrobacter sp.]|nr:PIN domain-containing protein [Rubrobacter sp.]